MKTELKVEQVPVKFLKPAEYNPRTWTDEARLQLSASLGEFGFVQPIVANSNPKRNGVVIGGNFKLDIAIQSGIKEVPVVWVNLTIDREKALNLRLNKNQGDFDFELLADFDSALLEEVGFGSDEIDLIFPENEEDEFDAEEEAENIVEPVSKLGDIYELGRHRLMCGSSIEKPDIHALMGGVRADMIFTDPPYGVSYVGKTKDALEIKNDQLDAADLLKFLSKAFAAMFAELKAGGSWYVAGPAGQPFNMAFNRSLEPHNWRHTLVWVKQTFVMGRADYHYRHELIYYGWREGAGHYFLDDRSKDTVWEKEPTDAEVIKWFRKEVEKTDVWRFKKPARNREHPTMKPVELVSQAIRNSSMRDWIILDPFGGSGSTLIAAETLGRRCYSMELDPRYVDVIIKRWEKLTGKKAKLCPKK